MLAGKLTLMAAADGADVTELSAQARADRVTAGQVEADGTRLRYLGVAHGWAGFLLATLRWCDATGAPRPASAAADLLPRLWKRLTPILRGGKCGKPGKNSLTDWAHCGTRMF